MKRSPVATVVAVVVGSALFFVLGRFVRIPSPVLNIYISVQYGLLAFIAVLFGPVAGLLTGVAGHLLIDASQSSVHWSWIIASGVAGLIIGLSAKRIKISKDDFSVVKMGIFNLYQICAFVIACCIIAPVLDMIIYAEPAEKVFVQGVVAGLYDIVATTVVGTLLCLAYSKLKPSHKGK